MADIHRDRRGDGEGDDAGHADAKAVADVGPIGREPARRRGDAETASSGAGPPGRLAGPACLAGSRGRPPRRVTRAGETQPLSSLSVRVVPRGLATRASRRLAVVWSAPGGLETLSCRRRLVHQSADQRLRCRQHEPGPTRDKAINGE